MIAFLLRKKSVVMSSCEKSVEVAESETISRKLTFAPFGVDRILDGVVSAALDVG